MSNPYSTPSGWWVKITDPNTGETREAGPFIDFDDADTYLIPFEPSDGVTLNFYGHEVIDPGYFNARHRVVKHDTFAEPAICACGWTRWEAPGGKWYEMTDHLADMSPFDLERFGRVGAAS